MIVFYLLAILIGLGGDIQIVFQFIFYIIKIFMSMGGDT
jgi:hypothetical protein